MGSTSSINDFCDWSALRGFNYQPSYGSSGLELWQKWDAETIALELARGKRYFPGMNVLRWWQSWDAYIRDPQGYVRHFELTLQLAEQVGCRVIPVLFNRWHEHTLDYGGIYADHLLLPSARQRALFGAFLQDLVGAHKDDPRVLAWGLCNEPQLRADVMPHDIIQRELAWLRSIYDLCKSLGAAAPLAISIHALSTLQLVEPISDVLCIQPYFAANLRSLDGAAQRSAGVDFTHMYDKIAYERRLDEHLDYARKVAKPLIATECCWGSLDDGARVEGIRYELAQLKKRGIGSIAYLLHHSLIADAHRPQFGPLSEPGNLSFIEADGSLRPGHEVFNEY